MVAPTASLWFLDFFLARDRGLIFGTSTSAEFRHAFSRLNYGVLCRAASSYL